MGIKLSELEEGNKVTVIVIKDDNKIELNAEIKKILKDDIAILSIEHEKILNFDNVKLEIEYCPEDDVPIVWRNSKIMYFRSQYVLQTTIDGTRRNRRGCFRVGVSEKARLKIGGRPVGHVLVKDISLTGFSITDRQKELNLKVGATLSVDFVDIGHELNLAGRIVRIEEHEDMVIYGLEIINMCKDLSSYVSMKQRRRSR